MAPSFPTALLSADCDSFCLIPNSLEDLVKMRVNSSCHWIYSVLSPFCPVVLLQAFHFSNSFRRVSVMFDRCWNVKSRCQALIGLTFQTSFCLCGVTVTSRKTFILLSVPSRKTLYMAFNQTLKTSCLLNPIYTVQPTQCGIINFMSTLDLVGNPLWD